ncbi:coiled-coil domain-containing protein 74B-like [Emydura macquarii macquarii]|uniref:coiled-coil domain-containing protein 74B-like n=1 Tax=Emydura macquarii macquarii TaxID=1129001 RepID=UPI00352B76FC
MYNTSLPPLGNLPQWSKVGRLDKSSHLQLGSHNSQGPPPHSESQPVEVWNKDPRKLIMDLERSLKFLQQQHAETLMKLHEEIEYLKRENKDLHYKLIMNQSLQVKDDNLTPYSAKLHSRHHSTVSRYSLTNRQQMDQSKNQKLSTEEQVVKVVQGEPEPPSPKAEKPLEEVLSRENREISDKITSPVLSLPSQIRSGQAQVPPASSNPFLVNVLPSHIRKPPTLEECEIVIHQLWNINHMQAQELMYLKSYLEDIHKNKRIPEDYLLASQIGNQEVSRLPKMLLKDTSKKCLIVTPLPAAERAVLPALKQTLGNSFAERQKRTQAIQRSRLRRTVL